LHKKYKILVSLFLSLLIFLAFTPPLNTTAGGWTQQFMPNLNGRSIIDIFFLDSLTGWAVTNKLNQNPDTMFVLRTTDSGNNWVKLYGKVTTGGGFPGYFRVRFLNQSTGFVCFTTGFEKTTDGGISWFSLNAPLNNYLDMSILNENTIWLASPNSLTGGVYFTSNGGTSWTPQFSGGNQNPNKIYMYNERIGFMSNNSALPNIYKTTNGGSNWSVNVSGEYFTDMYFADSLTGWKCMPRGMYDIDSSVRKTTNGGINWFKQILPYGGIINSPQIYKFSGINKDTLWGCGSGIYVPSGGRGILYRTTNGGNNWLFQVPDTSFGINVFGYVQFINKRIGWAYGLWVYGNYSPTGINTTTGGNDTFFTGLQQISTKIPEQFKLYQNYPNPFNPRTEIKYQIVNSKEQISNVKLIVFDIQGREITTLVNEKQSYGTYEVDFSGNGYSSGVYFYKIETDDFVQSKKMVLLK